MYWEDFKIKTIDSKIKIQTIPVKNKFLWRKEKCTHIQHLELSRQIGSCAHTTASYYNRGRTDTYPDHQCDG